MARRAPSLKPLSIALDRSGEDALHRQLYHAVRAALVRSELHEGERLPSTRALARTMGISRNTVLAAYDELVADGLIESRQGSGTRVSMRPRSDSSTSSAERGLRTISPQFAPTPLVRLNWQAVLRAAHYPTRRAPFSDPDGNALYLFDTRHDEAAKPSH